MELLVQCTLHRAHTSLLMRQRCQSLCVASLQVEEQATGGRSHIAVA